MNKVSTDKLVGWFAIITGIFTAVIITVTVKGRAILPGKGMNWLTDRTFIYIAAGLICIFGIWLLKDAYGGRLEDKKIGLSLESIKSIPMLIGAIIIYTSFVDRIGFLIITMPFVLFLTWFFGAKKPVLYVGLTIGVPVAIYVIFGQLLSVPLPGT